MRRRITLAVISLLFFVNAFLPQAHAEDAQWSVGLRQQGGGFYLAAPDHAFHLNILGYAQMLGYMFSYNWHETRPDYPGGFALRRARVAMLATLHTDYEAYLEYGTATTRPVFGGAFPSGTTFTPGPVVPPVGPPTTVASGVPAQPLPGIIEARLTANLFEDAFQLRVGKFIGPFSAEQARNPKFLETVERSTVLNSLNASGYLDTQVGAMLFGRIIGGAVNYYVAAFNGNATATTLSEDDNGEKDFQTKVAVQPHPNLVFGFGWETGYHEYARRMSLLDAAWTPRVSGYTQGRRYGGEFDFNWNNDAASVKAEAIYYWFPDSAGFPDGFSKFWGGWVQPAVYLSGNKNRGIEMFFRYDYAQARMNGGTQYALHSPSLGLNFVFNDNTRFTTQVITQAAEGPGVPTSVVSGNVEQSAWGNKRVRNVALMQLQFKF